MSRAAKPPFTSGVHLPEVLFEFSQVGNAYKVSAIDPITRIEISMIAPLNANKEFIKRVAARKLAYVIGKKKEKKAPK